MDLSCYTIPLDTPISVLDADEAFKGLADDEKRYCHFLSRASWEGAPICLFQTSPESVPLFLLLRGLFTSQSVDSLREAVGSSLSDDEFKVSGIYTSLKGQHSTYPSCGRISTHQLYHVHGYILCPIH